MKQRKIATRKKATRFSDQATPMVAAFPAPAGLGYGCDAVFSNPNFTTNPDAPKLIRCDHVATRRLVIVGHRRRTVKRCDGHAHKLRQRAEAGLIKIEVDEPLGGSSFAPPASERRK